MEKKLTELLATIEKFETELKENGIKTAITENDIRFLNNRFSDAMAIYRRAEKEINVILADVEKHINSI